MTWSLRQDAQHLGPTWDLYKGEVRVACMVLGPHGKTDGERIVVAMNAYEPMRQALITVVETRQYNDPADAANIAVRAARQALEATSVAKP